jgi:hypothetical protein
MAGARGLPALLMTTEAVRAFLVRRGFAEEATFPRGRAQAIHVHAIERLCRFNRECGAN